jgi:organic radical activating enzyme
LRDVVRVSWNITEWCNYQCSYCGVPVFSRRRTDGVPQRHSFDHYTAEQWVTALDKFPQERIALTITGGEPFMDRDNFLTVLEGIVARPRITTVILTNGSWNPAPYAHLDKSRLYLLISYHGGQTEFGPFLERLRRIRDAGFSKSLVHLVLAPENEDSAEEVMGALEADGFLTKITAMVPEGQYIDRRGLSSRTVELLEKHAPPLQPYFFVTKPVMKGKLCYHPALAYRIEPDGSINVACIGKPSNFITDPLPELPRTAAPCPFEHCFGCSNMILSLVEPPIPSGPLHLHDAQDNLDLLAGYRRDQRSHPHLFREILSAVTDSYTGENAYTRFIRLAKATDPPDTPFDIPIDLVRHAVPDVPMFGYIDRLNGTDTFSGRASDRLLFSGWCASTRPETPVCQVTLRAGDFQIGVFRDFYPRPEVAATFDRSDFRMSGWRAHCFLPRTMTPGDYPLVARATDAGGLQIDLPALTLRVTA